MTSKTRTFIKRSHYLHVIINFLFSSRTMYCIHHCYISCGMLHLFCKEYYIEAWSRVGRCIVKHWCYTSHCCSDVIIVVFSMHHSCMMSHHIVWVYSWYRYKAQFPCFSSVHLLWAAWLFMLGTLPNVWIAFRAIDPFTSILAK